MPGATFLHNGAFQSTLSEKRPYYAGCCCVLLTVLPRVHRARPDWAQIRPNELTIQPNARSVRQKPCHESTRFVVLEPEHLSFALSGAVYTCSRVSRVPAPRKGIPHAKLGKMGLQEDFDLAAEEAKTALKPPVSNEDKLALYALFKQATVGDVEGCASLVQFSIRMLHVLAVACSCSPRA